MKKVYSMLAILQLPIFLGQSCYNAILSCSILARVHKMSCW